MLVSVTITLLVVFAIVQVFDLLGETMAMGRATIEIAGQLRSATNRLQMDLDNLTCPVKPYLDPASGLGYFEYVEGRYDNAGSPSTRSSDWDADGNGYPDIAETHGNWISHFGDTDDILAFTIRSSGEPFIGRGPTGPIPSDLAEVVWWVALADTNGNQIPDPWPGANGPAMADAFVLLRRVLLIRPDLDLSGLTPDQFNLYDVSARFEAGVAKANSLGDLTNRQNRFARLQSTANNINPNVDYELVQHRFARFFPTASYGTNFPFDYEHPNKAPSTFSVVAAPSNAAVLPRFLTQQMMREYSYADWIVLSDVLAWDVRAFDEGAVSYPSPDGSLIISPSDAAYQSKIAEDAYNAYIANPTAVPRPPLGAFVDLGYALPAFPPRGANVSPPTNANLSSSKLDFGPNDKSIGVPREVIHYDTWSSGYEKDGYDQNLNSPLIDEATNGIDDNGLAGVDDVTERETFPPYEVPLPGIEVRIRIMEFDTRQVRQASVIGDFTQ